MKGVGKADDGSGWEAGYLIMDGKKCIVASTSTFHEGALRLWAARRLSGSQCVIPAALAPTYDSTYLPPRRFRLNGTGDDWVE